MKSNHVLLVTAAIAAPSVGAWSQTDPASSTVASNGFSPALGLNWYLNRYVKLVADFEHINFTMAPGNTENVLMNRIQLAF